MTDLSISKAARMAFAFTFIGLLVNAAVGCWTTDELARSAHWVEHTHQVIAALERAFSTLKDSETSVRAYLLTGQQEYLASLESAKATMTAQLNAIDHLLVDNPAQQQNEKRLAQLVDKRFESLAQTMQAAHAKTDGPRDYSAEIAKGTQVMNEVRGLVDAMTKEEERLLVDRSQTEERSQFLAVLSSLLGLLLGVAMVGTSVLFAMREVGARGQSAAALARLNEELEQRVALRTRELSTINDRLSREVVERRRAEHAAQEMAANLQRSNQELERFASVASHDLQEPLRKIQAFGDRLRSKLSGAIGEQGRDYLTRMLNSADRMRQLIDDLLAFSRVSTKGRSFVAVDLGSLVSEVLGDLETRVQDSGATVQVGDLPSIVADPMQIRQLLQNLVGNALKFRRPDVRPIVNVEGRILPAETTEDEPGWSRCELRVSDNGIGFEEHYLDRIFEVFQRLHGRSEYEGTGMGLAICRRIVERHGGAITARSSPGNGSTFIVTLPASQSFAEIS